MLFDGDWWHTRLNQIETCVPRVLINSYVSLCLNFGFIVVNCKFTCSQVDNSGISFILYWSIIQIGLLQPSELNRIKPHLLFVSLAEEKKSPIHSISSNQKTTWAISKMIIRLFFFFFVVFISKRISISHKFVRRPLAHTLFMHSFRIDDKRLCHWKQMLPNVESETSRRHVCRWGCFDPLNMAPTIQFIEFWSIASISDVQCTKKKRICSKRIQFYCS